MSQDTTPLTDNASDQAPIRKTSRLFFLDYMRAALVILVVLHHVAIVYGASALFYYVEPPFNDPGAYQVFLVFALFNQAWFMGALYLIAGHFTPGSYDRKGAGSFIKGRLLRLGVPLIAFVFVLAPISAIGYWQMPAAITGITSPLTLGSYPQLIGLGPLWFVALLLIFDIGYALWRSLTRNRVTAPARSDSTPGYLGIGIFVLVLALLNYLMRIVVPMGKDVLDFPTLSYLPQYLSFFVLGTYAYRRNWFRTLPGSMGVAGFVAAVAASVLLFPLALSGSMFSLTIAEPAGFVGNGTWQSAVYALWDSIFAVGMFLAAFTFFRRFLDWPSRFGAFLSQQSYAVYLIHTPILVFVAVALKGVQLAPLLKFGLATVIVVPLCFAVAYVLRKLPGVARVI